MVRRQEEVCRANEGRTIEAGRGSPRHAKPRNGGSQRLPDRFGADTGADSLAGQERAYPSRPALSRSGQAKTAP
jgi:hypothetical protein